MPGSLEARLYGHWGRAVPDYILDVVNSVVRAYDPYTDRQVYQGADFGAVVNYLKTNYLSSGGCIGVRKGSYPAYTPVVADVPTLTIQGAGFGTQIAPQVNTDLFQVKAPCNGFRLSSLRAIDTGLKQTSTGLIYLDHSGTNGQIHSLIVDNVDSWYLYHGIYSPAKGSDLTNSIFLPTFNTVHINNYRGIAWLLYDFFDIAAFDLFTTMYSAASGASYVFLTSAAVGGMLSNVKGLGYAATLSSGFYFNDIADMSFVNTYVDTFFQGIELQAGVDRIKFVDHQSNNSGLAGVTANETGATNVIEFQNYLSVGDNRPILHTGAGHVRRFGGGDISPANVSTYIAAQDCVNDVYGYNPVAASTPGVGASPVTFGPYAYPVMIEISGGTVTSTTIRTLASTEKTGLFMLYPGDTCIIVYTVAPTVKLWPQ